jgi:hypothetical protein
MKKLTLLLTTLIALACTTQLFSQTAPVVDNVKLDAASDYKTAEPVAIQAADYLFATPAEKNNIDRLKCISFIIKWMSGTPDYTFTLGSESVKMSKGNDDVLSLYMAALTKYALEHKADAGNEKLLNLNAITMVLTYCENADNKIKMNKELKKLSEAKAKGELEKAIE